MLHLNINREPYMGSPVAPLDLTLSDIERSKCHQDFKALYFVNQHS